MASTMALQFRYNQAVFAILSICYLKYINLVSQFFERAKTVSKDELHSDDTQRLIDYMVATLRDVPGVGLVALQVGESKQIFIVEDKEKYHKQVP